MISKLYDNYALSCLIRAEGDQKLADYLFETNVFNYFYRVKIYNDMMTEREKQYESMKNKVGK